MSTLIGIVVLVAVSALFYVLLGLALERADRRAERTESRSPTTGERTRRVR
jgi:hypothetical protein